MKNFKKIVNVPNTNPKHNYQIKHFSKITNLKNQFTTCVIIFSSNPLFDKLCIIFINKHLWNATLACLWSTTLAPFIFWFLSVLFYLFGDDGDLFGVVLISLVVILDNGE